MSLSSGNPVTSFVYSDGAPSAGTDEVQTLTIQGSPTGGTFRLSFNSHVTGDLAYNISASDLKTALEGLSNISSGDLTVTESTGTYTITFGGDTGKTPQPLLVLADNSLEGDGDEDVAIAEDTAGELPTGDRVAQKGTLAVDYTNGKLYINTGTTLDPAWTVVGSQT